MASLIAVLVLVLLPALTIALPLAFGLSASWFFATAEVHRATPKPLWSFFWFRFRRTLLLMLLLNLLPVILLTLLSQVRVVVGGKPLPVPWFIIAAQILLVPSSVLAIFAASVAWGLLLLPRVHGVLGLALALLPLGVLVPAGAIAAFSVFLPDQYASVSYSYEDGRGGVSVPLSTEYVAAMASLFLAVVAGICRKRGDGYFGQASS